VEVEVVEDHNMEVEVVEVEIWNQKDDGNFIQLKIYLLLPRSKEFQKFIQVKVVFLQEEDHHLQEDQEVDQEGLLLDLEDLDPLHRPADQVDLVLDDDLLHPQEDQEDLHLHQEDLEEDLHRHLEVLVDPHPVEDLPQDHLLQVLDDLPDLQVEDLVDLLLHHGTIINSQSNNGQGLLTFISTNEEFYQEYVGNLESQLYSFSTFFFGLGSLLEL